MIPYIIRGGLGVWFPEWKWFHRKFHKTKIVKIEGDSYLFCKSCESYIPNMPVGECINCGCLITPSIKNYCQKCQKKGVEVVDEKQSITKKQLKACEEFAEVNSEEAHKLLLNNEFCSIQSPENYGLPNAVIPGLPKKGELGFIDFTKDGRTIRRRYICKKWKSKKVPNLDGLKNNIHKLPDGDFIICIPNATCAEIDRLKDIISRNRTAKGKVILISKEGIKIKEVVDKQELRDVLQKFFKNEGKTKFTVENVEKLFKELKL